MVRAEDHGAYFRVPLDVRSLDYGLYFDQGDSQQAEATDYNSHNAERLDVAGVTQLLIKLPEMAQTKGPSA